MKRFLSLIMCMALVCVLCSCAQPKSNEVMLLRQQEGENEMFYYPVSWNPETGETRQKSPIASGYSAAIVSLLWWDGGDYLVTNGSVLSSDTIEVKYADFWASCYKDSILMHPSRGDLPADHEKLVLTEGENETQEYDISGLTTPDNKYYAKDLTLTAFMMDDSKLYVLFTPSMMAVENLQLYVAQIDKATGEIQKVSGFDAPKLLGPADEAASANICAVEGEGLFIFGPESVVKINPETEEVTEEFSSASFETEDARFTIKSIGYSNGYLLVKWMSANPFGDLYISAVKEGKVVGTIKNENKSRMFLPNV